MEITDAVILGRVGYQDWAGYWPTAQQDEGFAKFITAVSKHVASRTLKGRLEWANSTLIEGELLDFVRDLKQKPGKDIAVMASISLVRQLLFAGLLDELSLITTRSSPAAAATCSSPPIRPRALPSKARHAPARATS